MPSERTVERWCSSGTVSFSSTVLAPLIRAMSFCSSSSLSVGRVVVVAAIWRPFCKQVSQPFCLSGCSCIARSG